MGIAVGVYDNGLNCGIMLLRVGVMAEDDSMILIDLWERSGRRYTLKLEVDIFRS